LHQPRSLRLHYLGDNAMIKKYFFLSCFMLLFVVFWTAAQEKKLLEDKDDAMEELMSHEMTLRFYNAVNGNPIPNALVKMDEGGEYTTDEEGKIRFTGPEEDGIYTFTVTAQGYISSDLEFKVAAGAVFFRRFSISPAMDIKHVRIVLDWGSTPGDLDAHFVKQDGYHVSFRNMTSVDDGMAVLDRDDMNGYGPETITIKEISKSDSYKYFVHDYSNKSNKSSKKLSGSKAMVKVFGEGRLLKKFNIPEEKEGVVWNVFEIRDGQIVEVNSIAKSY
jgi:hypothetical protein